MGGGLIQASKDAHETSQRQRVKLGWVHGSGQGVRFANKGIMYQTVSHRFPRPWTKQLDAILLFSSILAFQSSYRFLPYMIKVKNNRFPQKNRKKCSKLEKMQIMFFSSKNAKKYFLCEMHSNTGSSHDTIGDIKESTEMLSRHVIFTFLYSHFSVCSCCGA